MATMQGITGKLSGKMGSAVFRIREGQQVVTQYNPVVKNPNTKGQQNNRAAFKLMSQLAAIMSPAMGGFNTTAKTGKGKPTQRNEFVKTNYQLVVTSEDISGTTAKIQMEKLDLTGSYRAFGRLDCSLGMDGETNQFLTDILVKDIPQDVDRVRVVVVAYSKYGTMSAVERPARANVVGVIDIPVEENELGRIARGDVNFGGQGSELEDNATILAYGMIPTESASSRAKLDNIVTPYDENFISAVTLETMVANGQMLVTETIGQNVTYS